MVTLCLMGITFYACTSEETVKEQPEAQVKEVCYVATIGGDWKTRTMYEDDGKERPSLVAKWGSVKEKTETISLYTSEGQSCGNLKSTIPAGGAEEASFSGTLAEGLTPAKAYYYKSNAVTSLDQELSLLSQVQNMSGSTAHISSQDYMVGTVDEEAKKITFEHMTAVNSHPAILAINLTDQSHGHMYCTCLTLEGHRSIAGNVAHCGIENIAGNYTGCKGRGRSHLE